MGWQRDVHDLLKLCQVRANLLRRIWRRNLRSGVLSKEWGWAGIMKTLFELWVIGSEQGVQFHEDEFLDLNPNLCGRQKLTNPICTVFLITTSKNRCRFTIFLNNCVLHILNKSDGKLPKYKKNSWTNGLVFRSTSQRLSQCHVVKGGVQFRIFLIFNFRFSNLFKVIKKCSKTVTTCL